MRFSSIPAALFAMTKSSCSTPTRKFLTKYAQEPNPMITSVISGSAMWYSNDPQYPGSVTETSGVALAGNIGYKNAKTKIISTQIHKTGKLLDIIANPDVILSSLEFTLLAATVPKNIPSTDTITVAVVKRSMVLGSFSSIISRTSDEPLSLVTPPPPIA